MTVHFSGNLILKLNQSVQDIIIQCIRGEEWISRQTFMDGSDEYIRYFLQDSIEAIASQLPGSLNELVVAVRFVPPHVNLLKEKEELDKRLFGRVDEDAIKRAAVTEYLAQQNTQREKHLRDAKAHFERQDKHFDALLHKTVGGFVVDMLNGYIQQTDSEWSKTFQSNTCHYQRPSAMQLVLLQHIIFSGFLRATGSKIYGGALSPWEIAVSTSVNEEITERYREERLLDLLQKPSGFSSLNATINCGSSALSFLRTMHVIGAIKTGVEQASKPPEDLTFTRLPRQRKMDL